MSENAPEPVSDDAPPAPPVETEEAPPAPPVEEVPPVEETGSE